ncbi:MFS transporter [Micromonospora sp. NPDC005205]|uniref:MFS transporter n=1 Tax=unclassified Micromonospora TaxID=2617518 RepID=UPI0033A311CA
MTTEGTTAAVPRAGRREWIGLAVLCLPTLLASVDLTVLYLALPHLSADLGATTTQQLWIVDIFGFLTSGLLVTMGTLGDRFGNRRMLLISSAAFAAASLLAAYATTPEMLIGARALLGVAGAAGMPAALALITHMFRDPAQRGMAIASWMSCFMGGLMLGPLVGGIMLEYFWWGSAFLLAVPIMVLVLVVAPVLLPERRNPGAGKLDLLSVAMSLVAMISLVYGLKKLAQDGFTAPALLAMVFGVLVGVLFVRRQRSLTDPLLDLRLFGIATLRAALILGLLVSALNGGASLLVTQFLQVIEGLSPLRAGLWLLPPSLAMIIALFLAPGLTAKLKAGRVIALGLGIGVVGYLILAQVESVDGLGLLVAGFAVLLFGMGLPSSLGTMLVMGAAPPDRIGSASSLQQTSNEFGISIGIATLGSIGMATYRSELADTVPDTVPPDVVEAAREGIAPASVLSAQFPDLLAPARAAFTVGLNNVAWVSAALMIGLAIFAYFALRHTELSEMTPPTDIPPLAEQATAADAAGVEAGRTDDAPQTVPPQR